MHTDIFQGLSSAAATQWVLNLGETMSHHVQWFATFYLLAHALAKIVLVWAVLKDKLWAYPWMIVVLGIFVAYQLFEIFSSFTWGMVVLTAFDMFIIWLTVHEWRRHATRG